MSGIHNHASDPAKIAVYKTMEDIRKRAANNTSEVPRNVVNNCTSELPNSVTINLPSLRNMRQTAKRSRQKVIKSTSNPASLSDFVLEGEYTKTTRNEKFLQYDSDVDDPKRFIIFATEANLNLLLNSEHLLFDGTFDTEPTFFTQLVTLHILKYDTTFPIAYALLPDKKAVSYERFFKKIIELRPTLKPLTIIIDFEPAMIKVIKQHFPYTDVRGCFFHMTNCVWRHIQSSSEIRKLYCNDTEFNLEIRQLCALAFVKPDDVVMFYETLLKSEFYTDNYNILKPLIDYFDDTWIGKLVTRTRRSEPKFDIKMWNHYKSTVDNLPRTNNAVEAWHRGFSVSVGRFHASLWSFINFFKKRTKQYGNQTTT